MKGNKNYVRKRKKENLDQSEIEKKDENQKKKSKKTREGINFLIAR